MEAKQKLHQQHQNHDNPTSQLLWLYAIAASIKLLLVPSYRSTDFEVHRNWLAITHSLPLNQWYSDESSPWTLDYPPFFAFFESFLSIFADLVDPRIVHLIEGQSYGSEKVVYFQRVTVVLADLWLLFGVWRLTRDFSDRKGRFVIWVLIVWSPGLLIVDHVHFQYNGFLMGFLLLSISCLEEGRDLMGGFWFAVLLCFKHLFAVAGPVYFVYLLRGYCCRGGGVMRGFWRLCKIGAVVVGVFAAAYGPFMYYGEIQQVIRRMFPFGRGLCHAYWSPNFWVFYIILDKTLYFLLRKVGFSIQAPAASFTGGLVGDSSPFAVLPQVTPLTTFIMVLLAMAPCLVKVWRDPRPGLIARWIAYAYTCGFLFGWHVHEKASLHFLIPLAIVAVRSPEDAKHYFLLSIVCCYSLFPLLFEAQEYPIKVLVLLFSSIVMWLAFSTKFNEEVASKEAAPAKKKSKQLGAKGYSSKGQFVIGWVEKVYLIGIVVVEIWGQVLHPLVFGDKFPFLPLMLISIYCAIGVFYSWFWQLRRIIRSTNL